MKTEQKHTPGSWQIANGAQLRVIPGHRRANAKLIAAAPELLAVAEKAAQTWTDWKSGADVRDLLEALQTMARAAIAKATKE